MDPYFRGTNPLQNVGCPVNEVSPFPSVNDLNNEIGSTFEMINNV